MFFKTLFVDPHYFWAVCITVIVSICLHELAHGVVAIWFGDRTPIETGHMTLNPVKHMGWISVLMLLVAGISWGAMPVDRRRMRGRFAGAWVALAGPATNILLAAMALGGIGLWQRHNPSVAWGLHTRDILYLLSVFGFINIELAILNLLPIPPLDGSHALAEFSPPYAQLAHRMRMGGQSLLILVVVFAFAGDWLSKASFEVGAHYLLWVRGH